MLAWILLAVGLAGEALDADAIARAEWSRDVATLAAGPYDTADLARAARALGRLRDPGALPALRRLAGVDTPEVRHAVIAALGATPGGGAVLRDLLDRVTDADHRAELLRALGAQATLADRSRLLAAVGRPHPEGSAAAWALGEAVRRGVALGPEGGGVLVARLSASDPWVRRAVAYALSEARPRLSPPRVDQVARAYDAAPDGATRSWLLPVWLDHAGTARRDLRLAVLDGPYRLAQAALFRPGVEAAWTRQDLGPLSRADDPWWAIGARRLLGAGADDPVAAARRALAEGSGTPAQREALLARALDAPDARDRSASAAALLVDPSDDERAALARARDPVVRELVAASLRASDGAGAWEVARDTLRPGDPPPTQLAALDAVVRTHQGRPVPDGLVGTLGHLARGGGVVGTRAHATAEALGVADAIPAPAGPDLPPSLPTLNAVARRVAARVTTTRGVFRIVLAPDTAPLAVATWAALAASDAYDDLPFHRVEPGFVAQTGDPRGDGMGGAGAVLPAEVSWEPVPAGAVGLAVVADDVVGTQWFVTTGPQPALRGRITRLGQVDQGLTVVQHLSEDDRVIDIVVSVLPAAEGS